ncbi:uncharacterized protein LOC133819363 [Humulus lupulus]|uniref:uncharacterized protein LOC133819363 n=1 Tax=Humulus lupulus TaxID=3486 RepID=UPI002B4034A2|nr:uncharacterized protein LOC133819363 [Humulus lupulus]
MGNSMSQKPPCHGKVILWDGSVHDFEKPITAAELMLEHPQHAVVEFQSAVTGKRPAALPADKKLETKKIYMMVPIKRGKTAALSSDEIHRVLLVANSVLRTRYSVKFLPLFARSCPVDYGASLGVLVPKKEKKIEIGEEKTKYVPLESFVLPESSEETPEYLSRQFSGRGWKPSLDTIVEKVTVEKKMNHWLF